MATRIKDGSFMFTAPGSINSVDGTYTLGINQSGTIYHKCFYPAADFLKYFK